jgi:hypothetical protein
MHYPVAIAQSPCESNKKKKKIKVQLLEACFCPVEGFVEIQTLPALTQNPALFIV